VELGILVLTEMVLFRKDLMEVMVVTLETATTLLEGGVEPLKMASMLHQTLLVMEEMVFSLQLMEQLHIVQEAVEQEVMVI